ncbi:hypothetical protein VTL71DRAFT_4296 [Oculimacula yallundae]|uniref:Uncharacterized protein n=1 Tax=Oculimacula yallundae TaxID=86028 RepID=A0ABR4C657_9HELO
MHPDTSSNGSPLPPANNNSVPLWDVGYSCPENPVRTGGFVPWPAATAVNDRSSTPWYLGNISPQDRFRTGVLIPGRTATAPNVIHEVSDALPVLQPSGASYPPTRSFRNDRPIVVPRYRSDPGKPYDRPANGSKHEQIMKTRNWRNVGKDTKADVHEFMKQEKHDRLFRRGPRRSSMEEMKQYHQANASDTKAQEALYGPPTPPHLFSMARMEKYIEGIQSHQALDGPPSPPTSYTEFLADRAEATMNPSSGPTTDFTNESDLDLEDFIRLFEWFQRGTYDSILLNTGCIEAAGDHTVRNINVVAKECRDRYLRDRNALVEALRQLLEVGKLVDCSLGRYDFENPNMSFRMRCRNHIDEVMGGLEKVEAQLENCGYNGNWELGWTDDGAYPRGRDGREIGNSKKDTGAWPPPGWNGDDLQMAS